MCVRPHGGVFVADEATSEGVSYRVDRDRGSEHIKTCSAPATSRLTCQMVNASRWSPVSSPGTCSVRFERHLRAEQRRLEHLVSLAPALQQDDLSKRLQLATDQFIVKPGARPEEQAIAQASGDDARTVIAGYH